MVGTKNIDKKECKRFSKVIAYIHLSSISPNTLNSRFEDIRVHIYRQVLPTVTVKPDTKDPLKRLKKHKDNNHMQIKFFAWQQFQETKFKLQF